MDHAAGTRRGVTCNEVGVDTPAGCLLPASLPVEQFSVRALPLTIDRRIGGALGLGKEQSAQDADGEEGHVI